MEGVWNFLNGTVTIGWLALRSFQPSRARMHPSQPAARARMHPKAVQYSGWWVPAGIPTASARVQMGRMGGVSITTLEIQTYL